MKNAGSTLFPIRFLGFGLFWAWLFILCLSPSPLLGGVVCAGGLPFEMGELLVRSAALVIVVFLARWLASERGKRALLAIAAVCGMASAPLALFGASEAAVTAAAILAGIADASLFLMWLTFFGYMKLGDTLSLLVYSYAIGALVSLLAQAAGPVVLVSCGIALPALSCVAWVLSNRYFAGEVDSELFADQAVGGDQAARPIGTRGLAKLLVALAAYAFVFVSNSSGAFMGRQGTVAVYLVEPACYLVLAAVFALFSRFCKSMGKPYRLYDLIPIIFAAGLALSALGLVPVLSCALVIVAYAAFELLAYNDCCNLVKTNDASLLKTMALARLSASVGLLAGWACGFFAYPGFVAAGRLGGSEVLALVVVVLASTCLFNARDVERLALLADGRELTEQSEGRVPREAAMAEFSASVKLSKRESEILGYLIAGRTTSYTAEKLVLAESTVRAHVHNIYQKAGVHSRMELLDRFEELWEDVSTRGNQTRRKGR